VCAHAFPAKRVVSFEPLDRRELSAFFAGELLVEMTTGVERALFGCQELAA